MSSVGAATRVIDVGSECGMNKTRPKGLGPLATEAGGKLGRGRGRGVGEIAGSV